MGSKPESFFVEQTEKTLFTKKYSYVFSEKAIIQTKNRLEKILNSICSDFCKIEAKRLALQENVFAFIEPELLTEEEISSAEDKLFSLFKENKYPVLFDKMQKAFELFVKNYNLLADRIDEKKDEIEKTFFDGKSFSEVTDLIFDSRETVCGSTCPMVIVVTRNGKFIYKPHDCSLDFFFHDLNNRYFSTCFKTPEVVKGGEEYGFCEFITNTVATNVQDTEKFYRNMGSFTALLSIIQGKDCHLKNVFVNNTFPVPVDLEMIVSPSLSLTDQDDPELLDYSLSCAPIGILPCQTTEGHEYSPLLSIEDSEVCCAPVVNGVKQTVLDYKESFIEGFTETFKYCLSIKKELLKWAGQLKDVHMRVVYGQKQTHSKITEYLNAYQNLVSIENRDAACSKTMESLDLLYGNEQISRQCLKCDILGEYPYFYAKYGEKNLYGLFGMKIDNHYTDTPLNELTKAINRQNEAFLGFNLKLIEKSFSDCLTDKKETKKNLENDLSLDDRIHDIYLKIRDHFIATPSGDCVLIGQSKGNPINMVANLGSDGKLGFALFLISYSKTCKDSSVREEALSYANILIQKVENYVSRVEKYQQIGDCEGLSGSLKCALLIKRITNSNITDYLIEILCKRISELDMEYVIGADKYYGLSGLISVYCRFDEIPERKQMVTKFANRLLELKTVKYKDLVLWDCDMKKNPLGGAAHGMIGIFQALYLAYELTGNEEYKKASFDALKFETESFSEKLGTWPDLRVKDRENKVMNGFCTGAPGEGSMLLSLNEYKGSIPDYDKNLNRAIDFCMSHDVYRDHLCCGNAASADFMVDLYNNTGDTKYMDKARALLCTNKEYAYLPDTDRNTFVGSLIFGAAGVGYELLRLQNPSLLPSVLI